MALAASTYEKLHRVFGFHTLRDGQEAVVERLLQGRSTLAIFPTGGGKSLCYQLPALQLPGLTLVISPLIALMKDQIDFLVRKGVPAARLDSSLTVTEAREVFDQLRTGHLRLLYVAPERLANERFQQTLRRLRIDLLAVDEAHCISEWGHNFRPDYLKLAAMAQDLKIPRVLALTATAPPEVAADIARSFKIEAVDIVRTPFYRSNLNLFVTPCSANERFDLLHRRIMERPRGPTIVYVTLQKTAEECAEELARRGLPARAYHAGLEAEVRHTVQDWFMAAPDGIVVATIAFGMGIDKADIRAIYHFNLPKTIENYAQEIGRAGRDGEPAHCEILACGDDRIAFENFILGDTPTEEAIAGVLDHLLRQKEEFDLSPYDMSGNYDIKPLVLETLLTYLELDGVLQATGPFYTLYKFQPQRSSAEMLAKFDAARAQFLRRVLARAVKKLTWFDLDVAAAAEVLNEPRARIVSALNYLEESGDLVLKTEGLRLGYRRLTLPVRAPTLAGLLQRFHQREERDLKRLQLLLEFVADAGCRANRLSEYFGEKRDFPCGHCSVCQGQPGGPLPQTPIRPLGDPEVKLVRSLRSKGHPALATPRQLARFLCGVSSPATTRSKLTRDLAFGALAHVPFSTVLEWLGQCLGAAEVGPRGATSGNGAISP